MEPARRPCPRLAAPALLASGGGVAAALGRAGRHPPSRRAPRSRRRPRRSSSSSSAPALAARRARERLPRFASEKQRRVAVGVAAEATRARAGSALSGSNRGASPFCEPPPRGGWRMPPPPRRAARGAAGRASAPTAGALDCSCCADACCGLHVEGGGAAVALLRSDGEPPSSCRSRTARERSRVLACFLHSHAGSCSLTLPH